MRVTGLCDLLKNNVLCKRFRFISSLARNLAIDAIDCIIFAYSNPVGYCIGNLKAPAHFSYVYFSYTQT